MNTEIKVYRMNDCDWVAASNLNEAIVYYLREHCGMIVNSDPITPEDQRAFEGAEIDESRELTAEEMDTLEYRDTDGDGFTDGITTFTDKLASMLEIGWTFPCLFASTEH